MAEVITLNSILKENSEALLESGDFEKTARLKEQVVRDSKALGSLIFTSCKHNLLNLSSMLEFADSKNLPSSIHLENENGCPLCRSPYNLYLPMFSINILTVLNQTDQKTKKKVESYSSADLIDDLQAIFQKTGSPLLTSTAIIDKEAILKIYEDNNSDCERVVSQIFTNMLIYTDGYEKATNSGLSKDITAETLIMNSLSEILRYIDLYGLVQATKDLAHIYHNLFLVLRLRHLHENLAEHRSTEGTVIDKSDVLATQRSRSAKRIITALLSCCEQRAEFIYADLEKIYAAVLAHLVGPFDSERTDQQRGIITTRHQACLRYIP
jgi:hypothetical protein